jgi:hypothetical protein
VKSPLLKALSTAAEPILFSQKPTGFIYSCAGMTQDLSAVSDIQVKPRMAAGNPMVVTASTAT